MYGDGEIGLGGFWDGWNRQAVIWNWTDKIRVKVPP